MSLRSTLGLSRETLLEEGEPDEVMEKKRRAYAEKVRPERLKAARRNSRWLEIENDLVPRLGGRWLVSASSDRIYQRVRGTIFLPHSVTAVADQSELAFYVDEDGDLVFLEQLRGTWTEHLEKQAAKELRKAAPKSRRVPAE
jgi:Zn-finger nucleic acid-binding protein